MLTPAPVSIPVAIDCYQLLHIPYGYSSEEVLQRATVFSAEFAFIDMQIQTGFSVGAGIT